MATAALPAAAESSQARPASAVDPVHLSTISIYASTSAHRFLLLSFPLEQHATFSFLSDLPVLLLSLPATSSDRSCPPFPPPRLKHFFLQKEKKKIQKGFILPPFKYVESISQCLFLQCQLTPTADGWHLALAGISFYAPLASFSWLLPASHDKLRQ